MVEWEGSFEEFEVVFCLHSEIWDPTKKKWVARAEVAGKPVTVVAEAEEEGAVGLAV